MADIKNVTVVGSGVLGTQIQFVIAHAGFKVTAWDINDEALETARARHQRIGRKMIADLDTATEESVAAAHDNITTSTDIAEAVSDADVVIEAVPEKLDLKRSIWEQIGAAAPEHTILCTNTSSFLGSEIADSSGHPERFLNTHFANNVWINNLVELMPHPGTDLKYRDAFAEFAPKADLEPVVMKKEQRAYLLNTMMVPLLDAARYLYIEDIADADQIDKDWKVATGSPMGPFEIMDIIGLRSIVNVIEGGSDDLPDWKVKFVKLAKERIEQGKSGADDGEGFYKYDEDGNIIR